jgi:PIN domain
MTELSNDLLTHYVFIDTQAFVQAKCDWSSKSLSKLVDLVRSGHIRIVTTSITKRETSAYIIESASNAIVALKKHEVVLRQCGVTGIPETFARHELLSNFERYFEALNVIEVPLILDIDSVLDHYFDSKPPFSEKKKSEFPDAIVVAALREWCSFDKKMYVVSADSDMQACCDGSPLISISSINEIISKALVREGIHERLLAAAEQSTTLHKIIKERLMQRAVIFSDDNSFDHPVEIDASVRDVYDVNILALNVMERTGDAYHCEMELEVELSVVVGYSGRFDHNYPYAARPRFDATTIYRIFTAEADVELASGDSSSAIFGNVYLYSTPIDLDASELPKYG